MNVRNRSRFPAAPNSQTSRRARTLPKLRSQGLLVELMKTWNYTVRTLASQTGISKSSIGNLTSGSRDVCTP